MRWQNSYAVRGHLRLVVGGETVGILEYTIIVQLRVGENERYRILRPNQKWIDEHERLTTSDKLDPRERPDRDPSGDPRIRARREQQTLKLEQVAADHQQPGLVGRRDGTAEICQDLASFYDFRRDGG